MMSSALDVPTGAAADKVRQMLGEKLREMGHDPANIQVIVEGEGNNMYVVDESGLIMHVENDAHVEDHVNTGIDERPRSALRDEYEQPRC